MVTTLPGQLVRTRRFTLGVPDQFTVALGGAAVLFLRSRAGDDPVTCLWVLDLDSGAERLIAVARGADAHVVPYDDNLLAEARRYNEIALQGAKWSLRKSAASAQSKDPYPAQTPVREHNQHSGQRVRQLRSSRKVFPPHHIPLCRQSHPISYPRL